MKEECADIIRADTLGAAVYWSGVQADPDVVIATTPGCGVVSPMDPGPEFATSATYGYFDNRRLICSFRCSRTRLYIRFYFAQSTCRIEEVCLRINLTRDFTFNILALDNLDNLNN